MRSVALKPLFMLVWLAAWVPALAQPPHQHERPGAVAPPSDQAPRVALAELEAAALAARPALMAANARVRAAQGRALQAGLGPNPGLGYTADEIGSDGTAGLQGAFIEQRFIRGGKLDLRRMAEAQAVSREELLAEATRLQVLAGVRSRFVEVLVQEEFLKLRSALLATAEDAQRTATQMKNNGKLNRQEELLAIIEARRVALEMQAARNGYLAAWRDLAAFAGEPRRPAAPLDGSLATTGEAISEQDSLARVIEASPRVAAAYAEISRAQAAVRREAAEPTPDVDVRAGAQYSYETNDPVAMVEVGVRLPLFNRNQGNILTAQADLARARAEAGELELSLIRRHAAAFARYATARQQVAGLRQQVNDATEMYGLYQEAFNARMASYFEVLNAQRTFFRLRLDFVEAQRRLRRAEIELDSLLLLDEAADLDRGEARSDDPKIQPWDARND